MGIQARMSEGDSRLYNPCRDVGHNFQFVIEATADRLGDGARAWPELALILHERGIADEETGQACQALCRFVLGTLDDHKETMQGSLLRSGWFDCRPEAQVACLATLGTVILGMHWSGVREATLGGSGPVQTYKDLAAAGERCARLLAMRPWQRRWFRLKTWLGRVGRALRGG